MKSGLRDRNNTPREADRVATALRVSMKSGLRDRNNAPKVRKFLEWNQVSMKSGLRDRNNDGHQHQ